MQLLFDNTGDFRMLQQRKIMYGAYESDLARDGRYEWLRIVS